MESRFDAVEVEVWRHLLSAVAEEMGATLQRTAYSPNIKERLDHSCALFDCSGRLLAQAAHIPVHLGAMPLMMRALNAKVTWSPGTMWLTNDPRIGGTHLPDLTLTAPIFSPENNYASPLGFVAARAHHADIGGLSPGSLPLSSELFHEGLVLSPIRLVRDGDLQIEILDLVCANSRTPVERRGDLLAQVAAVQTGVRRFLSLVERYGQSELMRRADENIAYAEAAVRAALSSLPSGIYAACDMLDDDGAAAQRIPICVSITLDGNGGARFDFTDSAPQVRGSLNATEAITWSACAYVVRCLAEDDIPTNEGCFAPIELLAPEGTIVNARFPAAVAAGNVETSQRIVDTVLKALSAAAPDRIPAASQGTMNNLTIGGWDSIRNRPFAYYETLAGGAGAGAAGYGASAMHTHMTNTRNTPIEALESHYPLRVQEYRIANGAGGSGQHTGGCGVLRRVEMLSSARVSLLTERRILRPYGLAGGGDGVCGSNRLRVPGREEEALPGKWSGECPAGAILSIQTPGGGGWGAAGYGQSAFDG